MNGAVLDALGGGDGRLARADKLSLVGGDDGDDGDDGGTDEGDRRRRKRRHLRLHETERRVRGQFVFDRTAKRSRARSRLLVASRVAGAPVVVQRTAIENSVVRDKARVLDAVGARSEGRDDITRRAGVRVRTVATDIRNRADFSHVRFPEQIKAKLFAGFRQDLGLKSTALGLFHLNGGVEFEIIAERLGDDRSANLSAKVSRLKRQGRKRGAPGEQGDRIRFRLLAFEPFINPPSATRCPWRCFSFDPSAPEGLTRTRPSSSTVPPLGGPLPGLGTASNTSRVDASSRFGTSR